MIRFLQIDLRDDPDTIKELSSCGQKPITVQEAAKLAEEIGAVKYVECSALNKDGVNNVFDWAVRSRVSFY